MTCLSTFAKTPAADPAPSPHPEPRTHPTRRPACPSPRLLTERGLSLEPLLTFYDRNVEDAVDAANLAAAWQEPVPLRDCAAATRAAIAADAATLTLWHDFPLLPSLLAELAGFASVAAGDGARIRMTFVLD